MEGGSGVSERYVEVGIGKGRAWEEEEMDEEVEESEAEEEGEAVDMRSSLCSAMVSLQLPPFLLVVPLTWTTSKKYILNLAALLTSALLVTACLPTRHFKASQTSSASPAPVC